MSQAEQWERKYPQQPPSEMFNPLFERYPELQTIRTNEELDELDDETLRKMARETVSLFVDYLTDHPKPAFRQLAETMVYTSQTKNLHIWYASTLQDAFDHLHLNMPIHKDKKITAIFAAPRIINTTNDEPLIELEKFTHLIISGEAIIRLSETSLESAADLIAVASYIKDYSLLRNLIDETQIGIRAEAYKAELIREQLMIDPLTILSDYHTELFNCYPKGIHGLPAQSLYKDQPKHILHVPPQNVPSTLYQFLRVYPHRLYTQ